MISQEVYDLFDQYVHNGISRRSFMESLSIMSLGAYTAEEIYNYLAPKYDTSAIVHRDDPQLNTSIVSYNSEQGGGTIKGQLSYPSDSRSKIPGILVVHENRGLNPYIEDVGRRVAKEGFVSLAPDALTPLGGYPGNDDEGRMLQRKRDRDEMLQDFIAGFHFLRSHEQCNGNVAVVGFCFGGYISNMMAAMVPELRAAVPYYGGQAPRSLVQYIEAPLQLHYAELDVRVNEGWPEYEQALKYHDKSYEVYFYQGARHGFHNNTTPRYDKTSADLAWKRTIEFFKKHL